jgi:Ca-activated chloride channel family protein
MFEGGRNTFSAAVMYENLVIESYDRKYKLPDEVVAIYPKEGTFLSDHPVAIVDRPWVTPLHQKAAEQYIDFLLKDEQQKRALNYGFRPGVDSLEIGEPIDKVHGVDPRKPGANLLRPPEAEVMDICLKTWREKYKKRACIVLVMDRSHKTNFNNKLFMIQDGVGDIIDSLNPGDWISILTFGDDFEWLERGVDISSPDDKTRLKDKLQLEAKGKRKLFDAIAEAHNHLQRKRKEHTISGVIVLALDEPDRGSSIKLDELLDKVRLSDRNDIRICTFTFTTAEGTKDLEKIANASKGRSIAVPGDPTVETVRKLLRDLATFF